MRNEKVSKSLTYIADAAETGYSALFTFAVKELLNAEERNELVSCIRALAEDKDLENIHQSRFNFPPIGK